MVPSVIAATIFPRYDGTKAVEEGQNVRSSRFHGPIKQIKNFTRNHAAGEHLSLSRFIRALMRPPKGPIRAGECFNFFTRVGGPWRTP
jgi:hypothetical protein